MFNLVGRAHVGHDERIRALDGIRGVAAIIVVLAHAANSPGFPVSPAVRSWILLLAEMGVDLFFCMSGYLITSLLLKERKRTGNNDLRKFYARRALRILPAYWGYVITVFVLGAVGYINVPWQQTVQAITFTREFTATEPLAYGILWSLCVEELFYALWPFLFRRYSLPRIRIGLVYLILAAPAIRYVVLHVLARMDSPISAAIWRLPTGVMDVIAMGCLFALLQHEGRFIFWMHHVQRLPILLISALSIAALFASHGGEDTSHGAGPATYLVASARTVFAFLIIHRYVMRPGIPSARILRSRILTTVGLYSYSLYLWHVIFVNPNQRGWLHTFPISLVPAVVCAIMSRRLLEEPFLRFRRLRLPEGQTAGDGIGAQSVLD